MAEPAPSDCSSPDTDREFDPSADMLVHDFDDERTLDEEEAMSGDSGCSNELNDLEKEGDMPIEKLLEMYGYQNHDHSELSDPPSNPELHDTRSSSEEEILSNQDLTLDKDVIARELLKDHDDNKETSVNDLLDSVEQSQTVRLLRSSVPVSDEESDDADYEPVKDDDWKKTIQVGQSYQAEVPRGLSKYDDTPVYEDEDRLLWDPSQANSELVEKYLQEFHQLEGTQCATGVNSVPTGAHTRDDEKALYLLLQCGNNTEEALRRRKVQSAPIADPMSLWSEEECRNFENGLRHYGKDFYHIQLNKVRTRTVGELVQFYYLWKKTERHDIFANKNRLEKKKYALHPGITDYMDRFLDEQEALENSSPNKERVSPPANSILYGEHKNHTNVRFGDICESLPPVSMNNMDGVQLNSELNTAIPTTLAGSLNSSVHNAGQGYIDSLVQTCIANIIPNMPPEVSDSLPDLEPPSKKVKTSDNKLIYSHSEVLPLTPTLDSDALARLEQISNNPMGNVELSISSVTPVSTKEETINTFSKESSSSTTNTEPLETVAQ